MFDLARSVKSDSHCIRTCHIVTTIPNGSFVCEKRNQATIGVGHAFDMRQISLMGLGL